MSPHLIRVVIAAQNTLLSNVKAILDAERGFAVVASCEDFEYCIESVRKLRPDLALIDASFPGEGGLKFLLSIEAGPTRAQVVFIWRDADDREQPSACYALRDHFQQAARHPLSSFLRQVASGWRHGITKQRSIETLSKALTKRERHIMQLVCEGVSNNEIGHRLNLSEGTTKSHVHDIYQKLVIRNRTALAAMEAHSRE